MRSLALIIVGSISAVLAAAAPATLVLEDFEGELIGWPQGAVLADDAPQGAKALRWEPPVKDGPQFYAFQFGSRQVEMIEWDRLAFDYKFEQPGCDWWGVKIVDHPLGDGMQATWQIAGPGELAPGEWRTATLNLQQPQWLWGDRPDTKSQWLHLRCQFAKGKTSAILIDHIRLERDPVRIETVQPGESVRAGDMLTRDCQITLANALDTPVQVQLGFADTADGLSAALDGDADVTLAPGARRTLTARLSVPVAGPNAVPPLMRFSTKLVCKVVTMEVPDKAVDLSLATPLADVEHPCLLITKADIAQVKQRVEQSADAKAVYEGLQQRADAWLQKSPEFPDRGSQWWHWYTCKECGARLKTESRTKHVCPDCNEVYSGWPYDDVVLARDHSGLANAVRDLGLMYQFTGERAYADKAREILLGYAERYLNYPLHNTRGEPKRGGGHVGPQTLDEATWLIPLVQGFDCVYDALSEDDLKTIADKLLLPAAELIHDHQWGIHNICCWHASAYGLVGLTLGNEQLAADAINGPKGFRRQIAEGVTDDGFWFESAWGYHFYTMSALQPLAIAARNVGIDVYTDRYKGMYDAPLEFMAPGGALAAFNDSGTANPLGQGRMYEVAYARWGDPRHLLPIQHSGRRSLESLLFGREIEAGEPFELESTVLPAAGYVILRSGATGEKGAERAIPSNYVALDYGPHGGGHGHPDKLGFVLYGGRALLAEDPGCIAYGNPAHGGWFRQTLSHNTIVVDGASQKPCTGTLQFAAFGDDIGICSARADDAYPDVRLRRTMALVGDRLIDVVLCESDEQHTYEWVYHNRGELTCGLPFEGLKQAPEGAGYEWAKQWRAAVVGSAWQATWRQEDGPGVLLSQAAPNGEREIFTAIGMGNPTRIKVPFVVPREYSNTALYATAIQVFDDQPPTDLAVRLIDIQSHEGDDAGEAPVALEVTDGALRDVMLINPGGGVLRTESYELRGQAAVLRYDHDNLAGMVVTGDGEVRVQGEVVRAR